MNEKKYAAGAALCPECGSVVEYFYAKCPWCSHAFTGQEALKILSMLSETGVESTDLVGELREAGEPVGSSMLPFVKDNFEMGSQGAKTASLLIYQEYGDLSELPVAIMEEGFKKSSNMVKIEIIKTLTKAGTQEAVIALKNLKEYENDPEVLQSFSQKISDDAAGQSIEDEISMEMLSVQDIEVSGTAKPPPLRTLTGTPPFRKGPPPLPPLSPDEPSASIPTAQEILPPLPAVPPPLPAVPPPRKAEDTLVTGKKKQAAISSSKALGIILMGVGFIITGIVVLVVLVVLGVKVPLEDKLVTKGSSGKPNAAAGKPLVTKAKAIQPDAASAAVKPSAVVDATPAKPGEAVQPQPQPQPGPPSPTNEPVKLAFSITASSLNKDFPASNMIDGDPKTVWQEKKGEKPLNHTITLTFDREVTVTSMSFITGYDDPEGDRGDMFPLNNRLKKVGVQFSDGSTRELSFADRRGKQIIIIAPPVKTKEIVLTILEVYKGSWFYDNAIAEIEVEGT